MIINSILEILQHVRSRVVCERNLTDYAKWKIVATALQGPFPMGYAGLVEVQHALWLFNYRRSRFVVCI